MIIKQRCTDAPHVKAVLWSFDMYLSQAECMEKEKLQPQHRDVIASDTDMCMV